MSRTNVCDEGGNLNMALRWMATFCVRQTHDVTEMPNKTRIAKSTGIAATVARPAVFVDCMATAYESSSIVAAFPSTP